MSKQPRNDGYESPLSEDELTRRMGSSAGRRLEERLATAGWTEDSRLARPAEAEESSPGGDMPTSDLP